METERSARVTVGIPTYNRSALLCDAIESVLAQSYRDFCLLVSDNASTDDTEVVVASFSDPRIRYIRSDQNIGMIGNFNRVIELADTELLMLLPDDDRLYPDYLSVVVDLMERHPMVGVVHTAFNEIDMYSRVRKHAASFVSPRHPPIEPGHVYLERSMVSIGLCFSTAMYRRRAIAEAGGMTTREEPFADVPLFMRIATRWDFAYVNRPLVGFRLHDESETAKLVSTAGYEPHARDRLLVYSRVFFDRRVGFLDHAGLPRGETNKYRSLATLRFVADRAGLGAPWLEMTKAFWSAVRLYPQILSRPIAWRFIGAHLGGRKLRHAGQRLPSLSASLFRGAR